VFEQKPFRNVAGAERLSLRHGASQRHGRRKLLLDVGSSRGQPTRVDAAVRGVGRGDNSP
jgi:hypothetical protein